ncbi:hypothetical protein PINS_up023016 [Pythium insidiosum]|nr:hypothetical protein PINS_up023016 [Pythium insidiosum]
MKRKRTSLDEPEFVRVLWRRMYVNNVLFTARQTRGIDRHDAGRASSPPTTTTDAASASGAVNIPLAHVIVSIKRRAQLKQFADYYASRGISGADRLNVDTDPVHSATRATPRHVLQMQRRRQAAAAAAAHVANITTLRERTSPAYDVVVHVYDSETLAMRAHTLLKSHRSVLDAHEPHPTPVQLPGSSAALDIACGDHHTVVLTDTGGLVAFGNNWHGQLGLDPTTTDSGCVFEATRVFWWRPLVGQREDDGDAEMASELSLPMPSSSSGGQSPSKKPTASASSPHRGKPPTTAYQPSAPRVYLLTAIGDTTAIVDEHGHVYVWGMCVAPGAFAGAAGLVGRWIPQRVDVAADSNSGGASAAIVRRRVVMEGGTAAPWSSIAVANGSRGSRAPQRFFLSCRRHLN